MWPAAVILADWIRLVGPQRAVEVFGIRLVGLNAENGGKLLFSVLLILLVTVLRRLLSGLARLLLGGSENTRVRFWTRQGIRLFMAIVLALGLISVWFDDPTRLATALGLVTAGLAFALQRVVTALAGYFVILRGKTFNVGDRITMGGVRGDVIGLGFLQTTIMEMGQPAAVQNADPAMWVKARQYTGRVVTVTNAKVFDEPVFNYTREFPYIWEEMSVPIGYKSDRALAERILLSAAEKHTVELSDLGEEAIRELERRYITQRADLGPRVYMRLTDNWVELTVRFIVQTTGIRDVKDAMSREILTALDRAGIAVASATFEIVGVPRLEVTSR